MKLKIIFALFALALLTTFACKKDVVKPNNRNVSPSINEPFKEFSWTPKEQMFFSLQNKVRSPVGDRGTDSATYVFHPLLINAYNAIAEQNDTEHFVEDLYDRVGIPIWEKSFVYSQNNTNLVLLPLVNGEQGKVNGIIAVNRKTDGTFTVEGKSRIQLMYNDTGEKIQGREHLKQKLGFLEWLMAYESMLFDTRSEELLNSYNFLKGEYDKTNHTTTDPHCEPECEGYQVEMCFDSETRNWSFGSRCNWPPHLDHDNDCTPNSLDPDFQALGISQEQFEDWVRDIWDEDYREVYGDYDDFWDDARLDWEDYQFYEDGIWDDIADIWGAFVDWIQNAFDWDIDIRIHIDLPDPDVECFDWGGCFTGGSVDERTIECRTVTLYDNDCVHDPWWLFPYGTDDEASILRFRLNNYWEVNLQGVMDYATLESLVVAEGLDPFDMEFESNVHWLVYNHIYQELIANEETSLSEAEFGNLYQNLDLLITYSDCIPNSMLFPSLIFAATNNISEGDDLGSVIQTIQLISDLEQAGLTNGPYDEDFNSIIADNIDDEDPALFAMAVSFEIASLKLEHPDWPDWKLQLYAVGNVMLDDLHLILDGIGMIPGAGEVADLTNGAIYTLQGEWLDASLSFSAAIPFLGWFSTSVKWAKKAVPGRKIVLKWFKTGTNVTFISDKSLRSQLKNILNTPSGQQAHHIMPLQHATTGGATPPHLVLQQAAKGFGNDAWHPNELANGINLSTARHNGSHTNYNNRVFAELETILANYNGNISPEDAMTEVRILMDRIRTAINNNPNTHINDLIF
ncbi:MAG TPA: hypothetical protein ENJ95_18365 [Bacteroidetes bacterium]|nr:hypothetical protein [Bacteroidota bacterium]